MESLLRKLTKYKHKLTANPDMISSVTAEELKQAGICLETVIAEAVTAFYREETKTVVQVNRGALEKIRKEAYVIQEKLTVPEDGGMVPGQMRTGTEAVHAAHEGISAGDGTADKTNPAEGQERIREAEKNQESVQGLAYNQSVDGSRKQDSREKEPDTNQNLQDARNDRAFQSMALPEITEQFVPGSGHGPRSELRDGRLQGHGRPGGPAARVTEPNHKRTGARCGQALHCPDREPDILRESRFRGEPSQSGAALRQVL